MLRRNFLQAAAAMRFAPRPPKRNVLFLAIDDLNDWIGCLGGHPQAKTPNLDRLASQGVLFTNAHCAAPLCNPSRASVMTGIRPSTSGVYNNNQPMRESEVLKTSITLPQLLRGNGYRAIGTGKIYHGAFPDSRSWDDYGFLPNENAAGVPRVGSNLNGMGRGNFDWGPVDASDDEMDDGRVVQWTADRLSKKVADPLFLACGIYRPHLPWYVPRKYFDLFPLSSIELPAVKDDDLDDVPAIGRKFAQAQGDHGRVLKAGNYRQAVQAYLASIAFADACVGRVLRALETGPNNGDFSILLWSDHGWHLGEKLHWRKFTLWEESTRSVLMASVPGVTKPGARCGSPVSYVDLYPTVAELCGVPPPDRIDGLSFRNQLKDPRAASARPALTTYLRGNHAVRDSRWRYIRYSDGGEELYDHQTDPMEWRNVAPAPENARVKEALARWLPRTDAEDSPTGRAGAE
jgi:arylsulfatase A-like enzyme